MPQKGSDFPTGLDKNLVKLKEDASDRFYIVIDKCLQPTKVTFLYCIKRIIETRYENRQKLQLLVMCDQLLCIGHYFREIRKLNAKNHRQHALFY